MPVSDLLGGAVRDRVPFSGYLFYKWAGHPGFADDAWGEALTPDQLVAQAHRMVDGWGFGSLKLKGGVFHPDEECAAIEALRDAFPDLPLRLDPNGAWTPSTSIKVAERLAGVVEYLEDPTPGIEGMAAVAADTDVPLATNMCVIAMEHLPPAIAQTPSRSCCPTTTCGAGCRSRRCSAPSPTSGAWGCRCTATPTSASRSPRWSTSPPRRRTSPTPATPTTPGRPRT